MKQQLQQLLTQAITITQQQNDIPLPIIGDMRIEIKRTRNATHGDFASNVALVLAKKTQTDPLSLADTIVNNLPDSDIIERIEIAGQGFINFFINHQSQLNIITDILKAGQSYGQSTTASGQSVLIEFVSANPTGPLHVGHGRSAAYGSVIANLLAAIGYQVETEYYVNDTGRQMDILTLSIWLRYLQHSGADISYPNNLYQGDYISDLADKLLNIKQHQFVHPMPFNHYDSASEAILDQMIDTAKSILGHQDYQQIMDFGLTQIREQIKQHLVAFGVVFDHWFSEKSLTTDENAQQYLNTLKEKDFTYIENGALWFRSTAFGDEKDRVIIRNNGQPTYFASDILYHMKKFSRGYNKIINIWGADHHGYINRIKAVVNALNQDANKLEILLVQFATLYRGTKKLQMSTRSGQFVTLKELQDEVGTDAARFFYMTCKKEQHLDFDLELAKSKTNENPVYYIQYAHARICNVLKKAEEQGLIHDVQIGNDNLALLTKTIEKELIVTLSRYPEAVSEAALNYEPHKMVYYLKEIAHKFHSYYDSCQFIVTCDKLRNARLNLITANKQVLINGLRILQISAPEQM